MLWVYILVFENVWLQFCSFSRLKGGMQPPRWVEKIQQLLRCQFDIQMVIKKGVLFLYLLRKWEAKDEKTHFRNRKHICTWFEAVYRMKLECFQFSAIKLSLTHQMWTVGKILPLSDYFSCHSSLLLLFFTSLFHRDTIFASRAQDCQTKLWSVYRNTKSQSTFSP